jgi:hypothetical protein
MHTACWAQSRSLQGCALRPLHSLPIMSFLHALVHSVQGTACRSCSVQCVDPTAAQLARDHHGSPCMHGLQAAMLICDVALPRAVPPTTQGKEAQQAATTTSSKCLLPSAASYQAIHIASSRRRSQWRESSHFSEPNLHKPVPACLHQGHCGLATMRCINT